METNNQAIYQNAEQVTELTGLSLFRVRKDIKEGKAPCLKNGRRVLIHVPMYLKKLESEVAEYGN